MSDVVQRLNTALEGRYRIERELGAGGMATVYLADDLKHERKVALKVLKPELAAVVGAERFLAEIKTTANLQHPHILPLFDSGEADSFLFYVMPWVQGETLRDRIDRDKQLPVDEAIRLTIAVANALQTAHDAGIVHRDIKPANILLSRGEPLVADFGIALAVGAAGNRLTETGLSVGTPFYMSPEQATGDQRVGPTSDIYALAAVLYEILTGDPPYIGSTAQAVLGKIIQGEPVAPTAIRKSIPANVDAAIRKALEKLPADRFARAQDFARALTDPAFRHGAPGGSGASGPLWTRRRISLAVVAVLATVTAGAALGRSFGARSTSDPADDVIVSSILPPEGEDLSERESFGALSPDGRQFAFVSLSSRGERQIWIRHLDELSAEPLDGTAGAEAPFWSPDGRSLGYFADGQLMRLDLGSTPRRLCASTQGESGSWGENDLIVIATDRGIERASAVDGACEVAIPRGPNDSDFRHPSLIPGNEAVLFGRISFVGGVSREVVVGDLEAGTYATLVEVASEPTFVPPRLRRLRSLRERGSVRAVWPEAQRRSVRGRRSGRSTE